MGAGGVSPSMALALAGFCFSVIFIVFVCSRLACALLRRRRARRARRAPVLPLYTPSASFAAAHAARHSASGGPGAGGGLDPAAVAALPAHAFSSSSSADADAQCVICLAEYEEKDMVRTLPHCGHNFHMACIDLWLEQNTTCPVCRISLLDNADSEHTAAAAAAAPPPPPPPPVPSVVISPPSSPESPRSDPCRCLFVSTGGHSSRASAEAPPRHELPDQENQAASGPASADGGATTTMPLTEVNLNYSPPENIVGQTVRKQVGRSTTQLGPCK